VKKKKIAGRKLRGLTARDFFPYVRWKVDQDYVDKLSLKDREWLARFNREMYDNEYTPRTGIHRTKDQHRANMRDQYAARMDIMSRDRGRQSKASNDRVLRVLTEGKPGGGSNE
jgi:hypothetical protein